MRSYSHLVDELSQAESLALSTEEFQARVTSQYDTEVDREIVEQYNSYASRLVPGYTPLTAEQTEERVQMQKLAKEKLGPAVERLARGCQNVPNYNSFDRSIQCIFLGMGNTPEDIAKKAEMSRIIQNGSDEERHDLFMELLDRMARFDIEAYRGLSDKQKVERLDEFLPLMNLGMEGENLLSEFKKMNCGVTQEEATLFTNLFGPLNIEAMDTINKVEVMVNPYYPLIDTEHIPQELKYRNALGDALDDDLIMLPSALQDLENKVRLTMSREISMQSSIVAEHFRQEGITDSAVGIFLSSADGEKLSSDQGQGHGVKWQQEGKTVYFQAANDEGQTQILAFKDFLGNGNLVRVPKEVPKPNGFVRFVDSLLRLVRGTGLESVDKYNEYKREMDRLEQTARQENITVNTKYKNAAETVRERVTQRNQEKSVAENEVQTQTAEYIRNREKNRTVEELNNTLKELEEASKNPPVRNGSSRIREIGDDFNTIADSEMRRLVIGALSEVKGTGDRGNYAEQLEAIALAAGFDRMLKANEKLFDSNSPRLITELMEDEKNIDLIRQAIRDSAEFSTLLGKDGAKTVEALRNPEQREGFMNAMHRVVNNTVVRLTLDTMKKTLSPEELAAVRKAAENEDSLRYSKEKKKAAFGSQENRERAVECAYKLISEKQTGITSDLTLEDRAWVKNHHQLILSVLPVAKERYESDSAAKLRDKAVKKATTQLSNISKALEMAQVYIEGKGRITREQQEFVLNNPGHMRDAYEIILRELRAGNNRPLTEAQEAGIERIERFRNLHAKKAVSNDDLYATVEDRMSKLSEENRSQASTIAAGILKNGKISQKNLQWAADNPDALWVAVNHAKHEFILNNARKGFSPEYENTMVNIQKFMDEPKRFVSDITKQAAEAPVKRAKEAPVKGF